MGAGVAEETTTGTPAPEPSAPPSSAPAPATQPPAPTEAKPAEQAPKEPPSFPWSEHRKLKNERDRTQGELASAREQLKQYEAQKAQWEQAQGLQQKAK